MIQIIDRESNTRSAHSDVLGPKCLRSPAGGRCKINTYEEFSEVFSFFFFFSFKEFADYCSKKVESHIS